MAAISGNWLQWLEGSAVAVAIRQSTWLYPALEVVHIVGIALLFGAAFLFDLRLLGFGKELPVKPLANHLLPWSWRGLCLVVPSGILLFITGANELAYNATFWLKMALLSLAGLNALVFHKFTFKVFSAGNPTLALPKRAKAAALISIFLWLGVIICGRWLAY